MIKRRVSFSVILVLLMAFALVSWGCSKSEAAAGADTAAAGKVYEWKLSDTNPEGSLLAKFFDSYVKQIDEATGGRVKITCYHGNSLGSPVDLVSMAKSGGLEVLNMGIGQAMGEFPVSDLVQVPFFVSNPSTASEVMYRLYYEGLLPEYENNHLKVLFFMPTDMQMIALRTKKILKFDDFKGMKIRANSGSVISAIQALGASPVSITTTEVYMSLERGVIDGAISSPGAMNAFKFYEPCDYLLTMPICTGLNFTVINMDVWNSLPDDLKLIIDQVSEKAYYEYMYLVDQEERNCTESMAKAGMEPYNISPAEQAKIKAATAYLLDDYIKKVTDLGHDGKRIVELAQQVVARCEAHLR